MCGSRTCGVRGSRSQISCADEQWRGKGTLKTLLLVPSVSISATMAATESAVMVAVADGN